jgi:hypothetical protein
MPITLTLPESSVYSRLFVWRTAESAISRKATRLATKLRQCQEMVRLQYVDYTRHTLIPLVHLASSDNIRGRAASYSIFARNSGEDASSKGGDTASWNSAAMPGRLSTDTSTSISLDPEKPSPFVVYHHSHNLIQKIIRQKDSSIARLFKFGTYHPTKSELNGQAHSDDNNRWKRDKDYSFRISFAELQRMHLRKLQCKLVKHVVDMRYHSSEPDTWEADLQQYG